MQSLLGEQPLIMAVILAALGGLAVVVASQMGRREPLWVAAIFFLLIPVTWAISVRWVTDREAIRESLESLTRAVQANDFEGVAASIDPDRRDLIESARSDLARFVFRDVRITRVQSIRIVPRSGSDGREVSVDDGPDGKRSGAGGAEAEVDLTVTAVASSARGEFAPTRALRRVILSMRKTSSGRWCVRAYNHMPVIGKSDSFSPNPSFVPSTP
jgi:hypothetical protein